MQTALVAPGSALQKQKHGPRSETTSRRINSRHSVLKSPHNANRYVRNGGVRVATKSSSSSGRSDLWGDSQSSPSDQRTNRWVKRFNLDRGMWCICIASYTCTYYPAITPVGPRTPARWDEGMKTRYIWYIIYFQVGRGGNRYLLCPINNRRARYINGDCTHSSSCRWHT